MNLISIAGVSINLTDMSWTQNIENYGKCIVLNENSELEPVKCDSKHSTICSVNNSFLVETKATDGTEDTVGLQGNKGIL